MIPARRFRRGLLLCVLLAAAVFVLDLLAPRDVAAGVLYVGLVLAALYVRIPMMAIYLGIAGTLLLLTDHLLESIPPVLDGVALTNLALEVFAIWAAATLTWRHLRSLAELVPLADRDELTELYNRRYFNAETTRQISAWRRFHNPLSLIMLDIDHFKTINDEYGHSAGDRVLLRLADVLRRQTRDIDTTCRYGGEEFMILMPFTNIRGAAAKAEQIRRAVAMQKVHWQGNTVRFQISLGVAEFVSPSWRVEDLVAAADRALYQAKHEGRNRTVIANFRTPARPRRPARKSPRRRKTARKHA